MQPRSSSRAGIDVRLRRIEATAAAKREASENARFDAALRLLSDEDLTGLIAWMDSHEGQASFGAACSPSSERSPKGERPGEGPEPPAHLWAAWQSAWERAGEPEAEREHGPMYGEL